MNVFPLAQLIYRNRGLMAVSDGGAVQNLIEGLDRRGGCDFLVLLRFVQRLNWKRSRRSQVCSPRRLLHLPLPKLSQAFKSASIYATAQNLITITDYSGYDPEVNSYANSTGNYTSLNVDYNPYPNIKTYTVGVKLGF